ncbi:MAG: NAD-dependent epimerase/dehydratase family protein [Pirellulaceae bacterium]
MNVEAARIHSVLVTGNLGYIGTVLTPMLHARGYQVSGFDTEFFAAECEMYPARGDLVRQVRKDIRDIEPTDLEGIDAVIHLAALSNDPLGELHPEMTEQINFRGAVRTAECAKQAGVKRFVYASSQSMYGISNISGELDEDASEKHPLTAYARTKWAAECELRGLNHPDFTVVFFRPSTVFGASPRLRCDIVFNNLVACAFTTGRIEILSDGTPWRPVIHVEDVCAGFIAGLRAPRELVAGEAFNVGVPGGNYTVRQLAEAAQECVSGSSLRFMNEHGQDARTYRVCFDKIHSRLQDYFQPHWNLSRGGAQLVEAFRKTGFCEDDFRHDRYSRLPRLKTLIREGKLDDELRWIARKH